MYPHPNPLPRWLYWLLFISGGVLLLTGIAWEILHYTLGAGRDALTLPHPGESWMMRIHGFALFTFTFALGGLGPVHVPRGWRESRNMKSGVVLIGFATTLLATGYLLYYWTGEEARAVIGWLHFLVGVAMAALLLWHRASRGRQVAAVAPQRG